MRRTGLLLLVLAGPAAAQMPMQQMPPDSGFPAMVANEIDAVVRFRPPVFTLSMRHEEARFIFYGQESGKHDALRCERHAAFDFVNHDNLAGQIQAGVCTSEAKRVRALAVTAPRRLEALLSQLPPLDADQRRKAGLTTTRAEGPHRTEELAFPVAIMGHGLSVVQTAVILASGGRHAVVVQADTTKLCETWGPSPSAPLCGDARQALVDIARRLERRFTRQNPSRRSRWRGRRGRSAS